MTAVYFPYPKVKQNPQIEGVRNVGFTDGVFSDGRPFYAECWAEDGATHLTFFFSANGIEHYGKPDIINYLTGENVIELIKNKPCYCGCGLIDDDLNNPVFSATITIGDDEGIFVNSDLALYSWSDFINRK